MKNLFLSTAMTLSLMTGTALAQLAIPGAISEIDSITEVNPIKKKKKGSFTICTGAKGNAYYNKAFLFKGHFERILNTTVKIVPGGGSVGCTKKLAEGKVDAAIAQDDVVPWLVNTNSPLLNYIDTLGPVLTEGFIAFCHRDGASGNQSDFGWVGQNKKYNIAIAGTEASGINVTLNAVSGRDRGWKYPNYTYSQSWEGALTAVESKRADCAVGVMSLDALVWEELDDRFGDTIRMLEVSDRDFLKITGLGSAPVYGYITVDEDHPHLDDFLDWRGNKGYGTWSPEIIGVNASFYYRIESIDADKRDELRQIIESQADTVEFE